jgi:hypothetical protein
MRRWLLVFCLISPSLKAVPSSECNSVCRKGILFSVAQNLLSPLKELKSLLATVDQVKEAHDQRVVCALLGRATGMQALATDLANGQPELRAALASVGEINEVLGQLNSLCAAPTSILSLETVRTLRSGIQQLSIARDDFQRRVEGGPQLTGSGLREH